MVEKIRCVVCPGGIWTVWRRLMIGSSTDPTVLESGLPSITEMGFLRLRARPMNRAPIRLILQIACDFTFHNEQMRRPHGRLVV